MARAVAMMFFIVAWSFAMATGQQIDFGEPQYDDPFNRPLADRLRTLSKVEMSRAEASHLHVLLLIDKEADFIGQAVEKDECAIQRVLRDTFAPNEYSVIALSGASLTPQSIFDTLRAFEVSCSDALFVYYSGHGYLQVTDEVTGYVANVLAPGGRRPIFKEFQVLQFDSGTTLARVNLVGMMAAVQVRQKVLFTDCCATREGLSRAQIRPDFKSISSLDTSRVDTGRVRGLLLRHGGFIDVSPSSFGYALSDSEVGSYATQTFVAACCYQQDTITPEPRGRLPEAIRQQNARISPYRVDRNGNGEVDWLEFHDRLWAVLITKYSTASQGSAVRILP